MPSPSRFGVHLPVGTATDRLGASPVIVGVATPEGLARATAPPIIACANMVSEAVMMVLGARTRSATDEFL